MRMVTRYEVRPLLRTRTKDGILWMFGFHPDDRWVITRNGKEVGLGTAEQASIAVGINKFLSLTRPAVVASDGACDHAVGALLDRIEVTATPALKSCVDASKRSIGSGRQRLGVTKCLSASLDG